MAFEYKRLTDITAIASSVGSVFTNPSGKVSYVRLIEIHNGNTTSEAVKLYCVPDAAGSVGVAGITNLFYSETLNADASRIIEYATPGKMLEDVNDTIQAVTDTADKVTISIYGGQE